MEYIADIYIEDTLCSSPRPELKGERRRSNSGVWTSGVTGSRTDEYIIKYKYNSPCNLLYL